MLERREEKRAGFIEKEQDWVEGGYRWTGREKDRENEREILRQRGGRRKRKR